jgi:hypothetical protein
MQNVKSGYRINVINYKINRFVNKLYKKYNGFNLE